VAHALSIDTKGPRSMTLTLDDPDLL